MSSYWNNSAYYNSYVNRYGYRYPRAYCPDTVCASAPVTCYRPSTVCVDRCAPRSVVVPTCIKRSNSFVQLSETKCEVRDHDQYDCKYDYKYTEAGDHKMITKSHKNHISNMTKSMSSMSNCFDEAPKATVEVVS